jgi:hypothetical protein
MTPELMIVIAHVVAKRRRKGKGWCKKKGIGAIVKELGPKRDAKVVSISPAEPGLLAIHDYAQAQQAAHSILKKVCHSCPFEGRCSVGRAA